MRLCVPHIPEGGISLNMEIGSCCPLPECSDSCGILPHCGGLSTPCVPFQENTPRMYDQNDALSNGTLFPGLNLPFYLAVDGSSLPETPQAELQALQFVVLELGTYLDTHPEDQEAFRLFRQYTALEAEASAAYEKRFGPLTRSASAADHQYTWLKEPWPWCYRQDEEG